MALILAGADAERDTERGSRRRGQTSNEGLDAGGWVEVDRLLGLSELEGIARWVVTCLEDTESPCSCLFPTRLGAFHADLWRMWCVHSGWSAPVEHVAAACRHSPLLEYKSQGNRHFVRRAQPRNAPQKEWKPAGPSNVERWSQRSSVRPARTEPIKTRWDPVKMAAGTPDRQTRSRNGPLYASADTPGWRRERVRREESVAAPTQRKETSAEEAGVRVRAGERESGGREGHVRAEASAQASSARWSRWGEEEPEEWDGDGEGGVGDRSATPIDSVDESESGESTRQRRHVNVQLCVLCVRCSDSCCPVGPPLVSASSLSLLREHLAAQQDLEHGSRLDGNASAETRWRASQTAAARGRGRRTGQDVWGLGDAQEDHGVLGEARRALEMSRDGSEPRVESLGSDSDASGTAGVSELDSDHDAVLRVLAREYARRRGGSAWN